MLLERPNTISSSVQQCNDNMNCMGDYLGDNIPMFGTPSNGGRANELLFKSLVLKDAEARSTLQDFWPGVPDPPFPNTNSHSNT